MRIRPAAERAPQNLCIEETPVSNGSHTAIAEAQCAELPPSKTEPEPYLNPTQVMARRKWDMATTLLLHAATLATLASSWVDLGAGAASPAPWETLIGNFTAFFILSSVFVEAKEDAGSLTYAAGLLGVWALMLQSSCAGVAPPLVFCGTTLLTLAATIFNALQASGKLQGSPDLWDAWRTFSAFVGYGVLAPVGRMALGQTALISGGIDSFLVALIAGCLGAALVWHTRKLQKEGAVSGLLGEDWAAWVATLLFMLEPVGILVS